MSRSRPMKGVVLGGQVVPLLLGRRQRCVGRGDGAVPSRPDLLGQGRRLGHRPRPQLLPQLLAAALVLRQRRGPVASQRVGAHQLAVGSLPPRRKAELLAGHPLRLLQPAARQLFLRQLKHRFERQPVQVLALLSQPCLKFQAVPVEARQQLAPIEGRRRRQVIRLNGAQEPAGVEGVIALWVELYRLPRRQQVRAVRTLYIAEQLAQLV
jgi:hypothetical protein